MANGEGGFWAGKGWVVGCPVCHKSKGPESRVQDREMGPGAVARPRLKSVLPWKYELV
jgi:hypothetical protein